MKKILKVFVLLILLGVAFIAVNLLITNSFNSLEIPKLTNSAKDFGTVTNIENVEDNYEIYKQTLTSSDFIDNDVNSKIESDVKAIIDSSSNESKVKVNEKAVYKNVIDTYQVSDTIVSVKVTSISKKIHEEEYTKIIQVYNYDTANEKSVSLEDLFKDGFKEKIQDVYTDNYLLTKTGIDFYNGNKKTTCKYNEIKDYANNKALTKDNLGISQEEYNEIYKNYIDKNKKMVAITFDDGPHAANTEQILQILSDNGAHATFFMLGQNVSTYPEVVKKVYEGGHEIGNHTWNHPQLTKLSADQISSQVSKTSDAIYNITGERPKLVRPPYGAINATVKSVINEPLILWNIDSLDWKSRDENQIVPLVMESVQDGDIILLHDIHATTVPAVKRIVEQLVQEDYQLVTVSQLLDCKGYDTTTTKVFYSGRQ